MYTWSATLRPHFLHGRNIIMWKDDYSTPLKYIIYKTVAYTVVLIGTPCLLSYAKKKIKNSILRSQQEKRVKMQMGREAFLPENCSNCCSIQT